MSSKLNSRLSAYPVGKLAMKVSSVSNVTGILFPCAIFERAIYPQIHHTGTVKTIIHHQGLRGMYRGLGPTVLGYLPTWAIYFAVYDGIKTHFGEVPLGATSPDRIYPAAHPKGYQPVMREHPWSLHILSAMTAGAASTICTNPLWVIKTRFMVCCGYFFSFAG